MYRATLNDLDAVVAISRRGSFRAAATDLDMSATALSHAIGRLEASLGARLFNRTTRRVSLTDAGRQFVENVSPALQDIHGAMTAVRSHRETPAGVLRIHAAPVAARQIISPLILDFLRRYPEMQVDLVSEAGPIDIVAEGFDLGVQAEGLVPCDMVAVPLGWPQRYAVVGSPDYFAAHRRPLVPADLLDQDCIRLRLPNGTLCRWQFERQGEAVQIEVRGRLTLGEASLGRTAVLEGAGIGLFLEREVIEDIEAGRLVRVLEDWTPPGPGLCLYHPGRRGLPAGLKAFLALARRFAAGQ